jgi:holin (3TMs family)
MAFNLESIIGSSLGDAFAKIVSCFKVDPTAAMQAQVELQKIQFDLQGKLIDQITAQIEVNKVEAANANMFVAGWRPAIGWICGTGLFIQFVVNPLATWIAALSKHPIAFPGLDLGTLITLLFGMLGLGGMRTYEKVSAAPGADKLQ